MISQTALPELTSSPKYGTCSALSFTSHLSEKPANKDITQYHQKIQQYLASNEYNIRVTQLFSNQAEKNIKSKKVAYAIIEQLRIELLSRKTADPCHLLEAHIELAQ